VAAIKAKEEGGEKRKKGVRKQRPALSFSRRIKNNFFNELRSNTTIIM